MMVLMVVREIRTFYVYLISMKGSDESAIVSF